MSSTPISGITAFAQPSLVNPTEAVKGASPGGVFGRIVEDLLAASNNTNTKAEQAIQDLVTGRTDDLHSVTLAVAQADLQFRLILEMRNRLAEAYQEIMRIQI